MSFCVWCGIVFTPDKEHPYQKFCCPKHRSAFGHKKERPARTQREREAREQISCAVCGTMFTPTKHHLKYCSTECQERAYQLMDEREKEKARLKAKLFRISNPLQPTNRICKWCGKEYPALGKSNYCCDDHMCMAMWGHPRARETTKICVICNKEFKTKRPGKQTDSRKCSMILKNMRRADQHHVRKTREKRAFVKRVNRLSIYKRDGWICQLCHKKVDPLLGHPHPLSASIDHILPLANGGTHEPRNVQLAHLICNCKKSNIEPDQLRLLE